MLTKTSKQSKMSITVEATDFLFCRQKPFSMREEIPFLQLFAERGLFVLEGEMKRCYRCKKVKPLSEFHQDKYTKDKHTCCCKKCSVKTNKAGRIIGNIYGVTQMAISYIKRKEI